MQIVGASKMHLPPPPFSLGCSPFEGGGSIVVHTLLKIPLIGLWGFFVGPCFVMHYVVALLGLQSSGRGREIWPRAYIPFAFYHLLA